MLLIKWFFKVIIGFIWIGLFIVIIFFEWYNVFIVVWGIVCFVLLINK